jgi:signal transduction histidine kinase
LLPSSRAGRGLIIKVLDRGPGIPDDQFEAVLRPLFRLEQSRSRETGGTGPGLAIAHQHALAIGGSLRLRNREGGGLSAKQPEALTKKDGVLLERISHQCGRI